MFTSATEKKKKKIPFSLILFPFTVESRLILRTNAEVLFLSAPPQNADEYMLQHLCRKHLFTNIFDNSKTSFGDHLLQLELKISRT
jgi:hypothetical protein